MTAAVLVTMVMMLAPQAAPALPDTPQGKRVDAYIKAFNTGDEKTFLAMMDEQVDPKQLARRTPQERADMFKRLSGDFGTFKIARVVEASAERITVAVPNKDGVEAQFTFNFEAAAPFKIAGIGVEIDRGPGL